jgi:hypothetical protein
MAGTTTRRRSRSAFILLALFAACRAQQRLEPAANAVAGAEHSDSLVVTGENGLEVWFTMQRGGRARDGATCVERALEIRRGGTRVRVPLLYTGAAPVILNQSTMRAELWNHCEPVDTYLVNLRTGQPIRVRRGST